ncbi:MAG: LysR family transcriptional regulator [Myxococcota bacterium]
MNIDADLVGHAMVFSEVAEHGSFTKAAHRLGLSKSTVSSRVRELEAALATRLLTRTTRAVRLTDEGLAFLESVQRMREHWLDARERLALQHAEPSGILRVTAPITLSDVLVAPVLCEMLADFPRLEVELLPDDRTLDLVRDNIDLAVRVGALRDSSLVAQRIGEESGWIAVARGSIWDERLQGDDESQLATLAELQWIGARGFDREVCLTPRGGGPSHRFTPVRRAAAGNGLGLLSLVRHGAGVTVLPDSMMVLGRDALRAVLPHYHGGTFPLTVLRPSRRHTTPRVRVFMERVRQALKTPLFTPG